MESGARSALSSVQHGRTHVNGGVSVDEVSLPGGDRGLTLRTYDVARREWSIYWVNARDGLLSEPQVGSFADGAGEFLGDEVYDGRPILVRYRWHDITEDSARWEEAFSADDGKTWEPNWRSHHTRVG